MASILTSAATIMCPHGGSGSAIVADPKRATARASILTDADTIMIAGCPLNVAGAPHPCTGIRWLMPATMVSAGGGSVLTTDSQGLCIAADQVPQGPPTLIAAQAQASA
jgi:hypothetical protein